jgi:hypothetical protein
MYRRYFGAGGDPSILVVQGAATQFNPTLPQSVVDRALERDHAAASAEYLWASRVPFLSCVCWSGEHREAAKIRSIIRRMDMTTFVIRSLEFSRWPKRGSYPSLLEWASGPYEADAADAEAAAARKFREQRYLNHIRGDIWLLAANVPAPPSGTCTSRSSMCAPPGGVRGRRRVQGRPLHHHRHRSRHGPLRGGKGGVPAGQAAGRHVEAHGAIGAGDGEAAVLELDVALGRLQEVRGELLALGNNLVADRDEAPPLMVVEREPPVPMPNATASVSPAMNLIRSGSTPSRSTSIWVWIVAWPWPCEIEPVTKVMPPSGSKRTLARHSQWAAGELAPR